MGRGARPRATLARSSAAMSGELRRAGPGPDPRLTRRLCAVIVLFIGIVCIFGGYMVGRTARVEVLRSGDAALLNLTVSADNLYRKSRRISPKTVHHNDSAKVAARILEAFGCSASECGAMAGSGVADLVRRCVHNQLRKLVSSINNASMYLDSLR